MALKRSLGLPSLLFYGVGVIIGAGIYSVIGAAAGEARDGLWVAFAIAAVAAFLAGLSYAELSTMLPKAGAEYVYVRTALPRLRAAAFGIGVILTLANAATAATVAIAFAGYLQLFVALPELLAALLALALCTAINVVGIREATWVAATCTIIEVAGLVLIIGAGFASDAFGSVPAPSPHLGILSGAALVFFVYTGFEGLANLAQEAVDPGRQLPRAILFSLAITTVLYVLVAIAALGLVSPDELAASESPLALVAEKSSASLATAVGWMALVSTMNTALTTLIVGSRLLYGMAQEGDLPRGLGRESQRRSSPWIAALAMFVAAAALTPLGELETVAGLSALATLVAFIGVHAALIVLRVREPRRNRPFRIPGEIRGVPISPVLGIAACLALLTQFDAAVYAVGCGVLGGAGLLYLVARRARRAR
jgi:APA family basic amino acid/polyamine antiporter